MSKATRLKEAINRWGSIRGFQEKLHDECPDLRGTSYPMIHRYLAGKTQPSGAFLKAAAPLLDVNEEWLIAEREPRAQSQELPAGGEEIQR